MALASYGEAKSVVGLSKSPLFQHQYSSISKAVAGLAHQERELKQVKQVFQEQWREYFPARRVNHWQTDVVNIFRPHAPCLRDRQYRHKANNVIAGNKPLGLGYPLALVNRADFASSWSLPVEMQRVKSNEDEIVVGAQQIRTLCQSAAFCAALNINAADSSYGVAKYITQVNDIGNLVNVIRLRHGNKVYAAESQATLGAPQIYGAKYYLLEATGAKKYTRKEKSYVVRRTSLYEKAADEEAVLYRRTRRGKELRLELKRWLGMKMRTKQGHCMKEVEFDVLALRVLEKETGKRVFKHDVFVAVVGPERGSLSLAQCAEVFYHRFDLEVTNRLMKQNLFLEGYQTPDVQHLDNWNVLVQEALWLLWAAAGEVGSVCEKWQQYSAPKAGKGGRQSASATRKGLCELILSFGLEAFQPKKCQKGVGRRAGAKQAQRKQYEVMKKWGIEVEISRRICQEE
jgi:DDE superfamily endonuclease